MSNLNAEQFNNAADVEEQQRRRFKRKRESGFVGNGYWFANYPYMIGALGAGTNLTPEKEDKKETAAEHGQEAFGSATNGVTDTMMPAATSDGGGMGGTGAGYVGGLG